MVRDPAEQRSGFSFLCSAFPGAQGRCLWTLYTSADLSPISTEGGFLARVPLVSCVSKAFWKPFSVHLSDAWWEPREGVDLTLPQETQTGHETVHRPWGFPRRMAVGPLFQDSPDPKPQLQAWGCDLALGELSRREAGRERAVVGAWVPASHLAIGPGVGNRPTLDSGPCLRQNTGPFLLSVWVGKANRLWVLAGLGQDGAAKKNADSTRAGFPRFSSLLDPRFLEWGQASPGVDVD